MEENKKGKFTKSLEGIVERGVGGKLINAGLVGIGLYAFEYTPLAHTELGHYIKMGGWMCIVMDASSIGTYLIAKATLAVTKGQKNNEDENYPKYKSSGCH